MNKKRKRLGANQVEIARQRARTIQQELDAKMPKPERVWCDLCCCRYSAEELPTHIRQMHTGRLPIKIFGGGRGG
jgi:hypothetical protein